MKPTSKQTVMKMREAYEKSIRKSSTENLKKKFPERPWIQDASSTWISRKELEALLNANNADGLRVYYGCHFESTNNDTARDFNGLHNLIFVATKDSANAENPKSETSIDQLKDTGSEEPTSYEGAAESGGFLCPPYCPTS